MSQFASIERNAQIQKLRLQFVDGSGTPINTLPCFLVDFSGTSNGGIFLGISNGAGGIYADADGATPGDDSHPALKIDFGSIMDLIADNNLTNHTIKPQLLKFLDADNSCQPMQMIVLGTTPEPVT